jgi:segregation and condensation protein B
MDDDGLSLEELSAAYAELLRSGNDPYAEKEAADPPDGVSPDDGDESGAEVRASDEGCGLSPKSILEAMLFVGDAANRTLSSQQVAALMRGVRASEIDDLVQELNAEYLAEQRPYVIASCTDGYRLRLRPEFESLSGCFLGRVKGVRLTQSALDVLAVVAYRQPVTREDVERIRSRPSSQVLALLVRRGLLRVDREGPNSRTMLYRTSDRFLRLFQLESLAELPRIQEVP